LNELIVSAQAESEMDDIWLYVARASQKIETANRAIDTIAARFGLLAGYPAAGRAREDLEPVLRILHILARGRDLAASYPR
jgi:plasmid stabilization system protein ParE